MTEFVCYKVWSLVYSIQKLVVMSGGWACVYRDEKDEDGGRGVSMRAFVNGETWLFRLLSGGRYMHRIGWAVAWAVAWLLMSAQH